MLTDGTEITIRPLAPSDRTALAEGYAALSPDSRRRRFFSPPNRMSEAHLDRLMDVDGDRSFALGAECTTGEDGTTPGPGIGVARWIRDRSNRHRAEAAITVADAWQGKGVGTALLTALIDHARAAGIDTFTADVLWENTTVLEPLRFLGARIAATEPGVATVELDLPDAADELAGSVVQRFLAVAARASAG